MIVASSKASRLQPMNYAVQNSIYNSTPHVLILPGYSEQAMACKLILGGLCIDGATSAASWAMRLRAQAAVSAAIITSAAADADLPSSIRRVIGLTTPLATKAC